MLFLSYFLPVTIIPILVCAGIMWYFRGIPNIWSVIWRGALIAPLCYFIITEIPFFQSSYFETMETPALCRAFFSAAIPEEISKLATLYYLAWRVYKWHYEKFSNMLLCSIIIGTAFSITENFIYSGIGLMRILAFFGHLSYAVIMGYYFSLLYYSKIQKHRWLAYVAMIGFPILFHGLWDANGLGLFKECSGWLSGFVFLLSLCLPFTLLYIVYKLLRNAKQYDAKEDQISWNNSTN